MQSRGSWQSTVHILGGTRIGGDTDYDDGWSSALERISPCFLNVGGRASTANGMKLDLT